ncbi:MAG: ABC transporter substrate-binding protein, partial [Mycobacterium leprae]
IQMDYSYLNEYAGRNALLDLTPYSGQQLDLGHMDKNLVNAGKVGDKLYAISLGGNVQALQLNKSMLDQAGLPVPPMDWTWADFEHYGQVIKVKLGPGMWFSTDASNNMVVFEYWLRQRGLPGMWNGTNFAFTEKDLAEWWTYWDKLRKQGFVPNGEQSASYSGDIANSMWVKGKVATQFGYAAEFEKWATIVKDDVVMVPYPRGGQADGHYVKPSMYWSVYGKTKHPQEALAFINWFINDPEAAKILGTTRGVPVTTTALDAVKDAGLTKYDMAVNDMTTKIMAFAGPTPTPAPKGSTDIGKLFTQLSQEQAFGRTTPAQAAKDFMTQGAKILQQANGK